ncbi:type II toxin-antitoxin system PrlF family antitoxin [Pseudomonas sp. GM55]|uniref:type II toxin-antitoxin system PrlF family antitoxin n=1 Tax=Pseudomonas sp. GM55 TaxID=1144333 RepID=UPI0005B787BF
MNDSNPTPSISTTHSRSASEHASTSENDQELSGFLKLLEDDILSNPESLIALDSTVLARLDSLVGGIDVDINSPLSADEE